MHKECPFIDLMQKCIHVLIQADMYYDISVCQELFIFLAAFKLKYNISYNMITCVAYCLKKCSGDVVSEIQLLLIDM